ncbi:carbohydrate kinase [Picosynechococcus sp. PCC 7003]|uniref:FGGY-family carbohydrate kinase n=1 Tax=Picosynechococcus sp. PCC 7003 TaxID=374981 RepID=UPI0008107466|nr:FGGY-family carbohydrate kinase [Picosynechococcus sp. PCC 7003]ANV83331.1 carbohydrate kinase [Picosynechococcus sp. PCC 7003]
MTALFSLGIDFGTSGARAIAITEHREIVQTVTVHSLEQTPQGWREALWHLLAAFNREIRQNLQAIAINGTSGTVLLCDDDGKPCTEALLYNDDRGKTVLPMLQTLAPPQHLVQSATSSLAKLLWFESQDLTTPASYFLHQADWLSGLLHGNFGQSDYHNALKLGYDVENLRYPPWLQRYPLFDLLPQVQTPGGGKQNILATIAQRFGINPHCQICAGTTDSIAAFIASGASEVGEAVTSLGSTLVLKLLGDRPVQDLAAGVYSHRFGHLWLSGGASNTGGAVLKHYFDATQLQDLSVSIDPTADSGLDYYPLLKPGDRFPFNDPNLPPRLTPRPTKPRQFLQGLLEGIARIEAQGYRRLEDLGSPRVERVFTAGGGAQNPVWTKIRARYLSCPVLISPQPDAAYGTALLAQRGLLRI